MAWATRPDQLDGSDLVLLPGSRATVTDLQWMRARGLDRAIASRAQDGEGLVIGICAGYQMLGTTIDDPVESGVGSVDGLGLLPSVTTFAQPKIVRRSTGTAQGHQVAGYQIRFGRPFAQGAAWLSLDGEPEGAVSASGRVRGTSLHGLFDRDSFRAALLTELAATAGRHYQPAPCAFVDAVEAQHERLADWLEAHLDVDSLLDLASTAAPVGTWPGW
jgi:adenosylcobyric acid synthase